MKIKVIDTKPKIDEIGKVDLPVIKGAGQPYGLLLALTQPG